MKKTLIPLLAIALVVAVLATAVFYGLIADRLQPPSSAQAAGGKMVAAARVIERGKALDPQDLKLLEGVCPMGAGKCLSEPERLVGRITAQPLVEGQILSESMLSRPDTGETPSASIPKGWRAVTLHIAESSGVINLLRAGDRVDIQVIAPREAHSQVFEIRSLLQNVEVMQIGPPEIAHSPVAGRPVVTVLVPPSESERLSLADATGRVRIVLRNRQESEKESPAVANSTVAKPAAALPPAPVPTATATPTPVIPPAPTKVEFLVRMASGDTAAFKQLGGPEDWSTLQVRAVPSSINLEGVLNSLTASKTIAVLSSSRVQAPNKGEASVTADSYWRPVEQKTSDTAGLAIRFTPTFESKGVRVKVEPEVTARLKGAEAATMRRIETELNIADGQSFLVSGLADPEHRDEVLGRLLPKMIRAEHELVVLVTAKFAR